MDLAFTIVDIETTGNGIQGNKITEIAIFRLEQGEVVRTYTSLVNPGCPIPYYITALTGIDNQMVARAPTLSEIAADIEDITRDSIFVAHSVNFDYQVIKKEFRELGREFLRKRLCTVRLSRQMFPGLRSYSLGKLCTALDIPLTDRHRAEGDARATVTLFQKILNHANAESVIHRFLHARSQEATLPPELPRAAYEALPEKPGVYYFKNAGGKVIYVGKAKNLRKRVLSHFYDKADQEVRMCRETRDIAFELSGSELLALLMESAAIKSLYPPFNRAQKRQIPSYGIFHYRDRKGIDHLAYNRCKGIPSPLAVFYSVTDCRLFLEQLCRDFGLCAKYCHLQETPGPCNHFRLPVCEGICRESETVASYNAKVQRAIQDLQADKGHVLIRETGRNSRENGIVLLRNGNYCGYGFIDKERAVPGLEEALACIIPQKNTPETERLLRTYSLKHPENMLELVEILS